MSQQCCSPGWAGKDSLSKHCTPVGVGFADAQHYTLDAFRAEEPRVSKGPETSVSLMEAFQSV